MLIKSQTSQQGHSNPNSQSSNVNQEFKITHHSESSNSENLSAAKKLSKKTSGAMQDANSGAALNAGNSNNNTNASKNDAAGSTELSSKASNHKIKKKNSKFAVCLWSFHIFKFNPNYSVPSKNMIFRHFFLNS